MLNPFTGYYTDQRVCPVQVGFGRGLGCGWVVLFGFFLTSVCFACMLQAFRYFVVVICVLLSPSEEEI